MAPKRKYAVAGGPVGQTPLARALNALMVKRDLSGYEVAILADLDPDTVYRILQGKVRAPSIQTVVALARVLGVTVDSLTS